MRTFLRLSVFKLSVPFCSLFALPILLSLSSSTLAAEYSCESFIGSFANKPDGEAALKVVKDGNGFAALAPGDAPDSWERMPLQVGLPDEVKNEMLAEGGKVTPLKCALRGEGFVLWQFADGSPDNPSESESRSRSKYPKKTPYMMFIHDGFAAGESGLYRVTTQD
ncbi:hypothetical protein [Pseudomonas palleroniana]|uniref:hypothetical protein n=1 Tax=Pseudomonas palleroniana TaxID=191390 RepID=UPI0018E6A7C0|nr:hypothetical protein [Pseudomonas palleroniana]MBI6910199.1 hypothetical protein [Pseudomonas palleroniana]